MMARRILSTLCSVLKLCDGNAEAHLMQGDAALQRLAQEIEGERETKKSARPKPMPQSPLPSKFGRLAMLLAMRRA